MQKKLDELDMLYGKPAALLLGLRAKEALSQREFAERLGIGQSNLCNMEKGRRPIGKVMAKRLEKEFGINYRYFLG